MLKHAPWLACSTVLNLLFAGSVFANQHSADDLIGTWATQGYGAQVLITPCGNAEEQLCGHITWLWTDRDLEGQLLRDNQNPVARHRDRPLVGIQIFRNFTRNDDGHWQGEGIYNPEDGITYAASLKPHTDGTLNVTGCVLGIFCQTQVWRRPQSVCPASLPLTPRK